MTTRSARTERKICDIDFADDIVLLSGSPTEAQDQLNSFSKEAKEVGILINADKTKRLCLNQPEGQSIDPMRHEDNIIEVVEDFKYLGSYVVSTENDIQARVGLTWSAFNLLRPVLTANKLELKLRMRIFNAACISILLYGCETWTLTQKLEDKLNIFVRKLYRLMLNIKQAEAHLTNEDLYKRVRQQPIAEEIRKRQLRFIGHVLRMSQ